ncbi:MAG: hypothetical protein K9K88_07500 [Desulfobacterales bacterium]|nr:hypothetical protein [Desulfobacterales bacterium]
MITILHGAAETIKISFRNLDLANQGCLGFPKGVDAVFFGNGSQLRHLDAFHLFEAHRYSSRLAAEKINSKPPAQRLLEMIVFIHVL